MPFLLRLNRKKFSAAKCLVHHHWTLHPTQSMEKCPKHTSKYEMVLLFAPNPESV